jgi:hypothetical protein
MRLQLRNKKRRIERQQQAAERQDVYDALTPQQKLDRALARGGRTVGSSATREVRHLAALIRGTADHVSNIGGAK